MDHALLFRFRYYFFHTIARQGQTRLTARLSGAFCSFRLGGRQPTCVSKNKNHSKIHSCQVQAVLPEQKCVQTRKGPQKILIVLSRDLTLYGPISARQNRVCPCQAMVIMGHMGPEKRKRGIKNRKQEVYPFCFRSGIR